MKKIYFIIFLIISSVLIFSAFKIITQNDKPVDTKEKNIISGDEPLSNDASASDKIDIENTAIVCKNGDKYLGADLIKNKINFSLIGSRVFYKGEELERLCNPSLKEYDFDSEPSYAIIPAYIMTK